MFGFFKKSAPVPPPLPATPDRFRVGFATLEILNLLTIARGMFFQELIGGSGKKFLEFVWGKFCARNLPLGTQVPTLEIKATAAKKGDFVVGSIVFPGGNAVGEPLLGLIVFGPCNDPEWPKEAWETVPARYFILFRALSGTSIEEWTANPPTPRGAGPAPDEFAFIDHVISSMLGIVKVPTEDGEMSKAIERARRELPGVLARFVGGELNDCLFTVKVAFREGEVVEHVWLSHTTFADGLFSGVLDCELRDLKQVRSGDRVTAKMEDVTDWGYVREGKMFGNYTLRAMLPNMSPDVAEKYRCKLADD